MQNQKIGRNNDMADLSKVSLMFTIGWIGFHPNGAAPSMNQATIRTTRDKSNLGPLLRSWLEQTIRQFLWLDTPGNVLITTSVSPQDKLAIPQEILIKGTPNLKNSTRDTFLKNHHHKPKKHVKKYYNNHINNTNILFAKEMSPFGFPVVTTFWEAHFHAGKAHEPSIAESHGDSGEGQEPNDDLKEEETTWRNIFFPFFYPKDMSIQPVGIFIYPRILHWKMFYQTINWFLHLFLWVLSEEMAKGKTSVKKRCKSFVGDEIN